MIRTGGYLLGFSVKRRATRRKAIVVYWCFCVWFCSLIITRGFETQGTVSFLICLFLCFSIIAGELGGIRANGAVKRFEGLRHRERRPTFQTLLKNEPLDAEGTVRTSDPMDEREEKIRDHAHFDAFKFSRRLSLLLLVCFVFLDMSHTQNLLHIAQAFLFGIALTMWSLPQTLILWSEPDMEPADEGSGEAQA
jgi:hypothetical protein